MDQALQTPPGQDIFQNAQQMSNIAATNQQTSQAAGEAPLRLQDFKQKLQTQALQNQLLDLNIQSVKARAPLEMGLLKSQGTQAQSDADVAQATTDTRISGAKTSLQIAQQAFGKAQLANELSRQLNSSLASQEKSRASILGTEAQWSPLTEEQKFDLNKEALAQSKTQTGMLEQSAFTQKQMAPTLQKQTELGLQQAYQAYDMGNVELGMKRKQAASLSDSLTFGHLSNAVTLVNQMADLSPQVQQSFIDEGAKDPTSPLGALMKHVQVTGVPIDQMIENPQKYGIPDSIKNDPKATADYVNLIASAASTRIAGKTAGAMMPPQTGQDIESYSQNIKKQLAGVVPQMMQQIIKNQGNNAGTQNPGTQQTSNNGPPSITKPTTPAQALAPTPSTKPTTQPTSQPATQPTTQATSTPTANGSESPQVQPFFDAFNVQGKDENQNKEYSRLVQDLMFSHFNGNGGTPAQVLQNFVKDKGKTLDKVFTPEQTQALLKLRQQYSWSIK